MEGKRTRGLWGKEARFDGARIAKKASVERFFVPVIQTHVKRTDRVLDIGCGSGGFLLAAAPHCKDITGVDITEQFVIAAQNTAKESGVTNATIQHVKTETLPFPPESFDVVIMVDVIHHLDDIQGTLSEALRVLKHNGKIIVFEPNKLNPLLALMCVLDRNEWGLLKLGTRRIYRRMLEKHYQILTLDYSGLLIGPESPLFLALANFLSQGVVSKLLGWMSPKIVLVGKKI